MGILVKTLSLLSFVVGLVISVLVYAHYTKANGAIVDAVSGSLQSSPSRYFRGEKEELPSLSTVRVSAPKNGSEARNFEIEHVDGPYQTMQIVIEDEAFPNSGADVVEAPIVEGPPEGAGIGELVSYYFGRVSTWLFGEREAKIQMACKTKIDGGKICSVNRK